MGNLRRSFRTSAIEAFAANSLASMLSFKELEELAVHCQEVDTTKVGFFTATEFRHVLKESGHADIAIEIARSVVQAVRFPGESYIDYIAILDSARARRERLFEDELWRCLCEFAWSGDVVEPTVTVNGRLPVDKLTEFLQGADVLRSLSRDGVEDCAALANDLLCAAYNVDDDLDTPQQVDFAVLCEEALRHFPPWPASHPKPQQQRQPQCQQLQQRPQKQRQEPAESLMIPQKAQQTLENAKHGLRAATSLRTAQYHAKVSVILQDLKEDLEAMTLEDELKDERSTVNPSDDGSEQHSAVLNRRADQVTAGGSDKDTL